MQRLDAGRRVNLADVNRPQRHRLGQAAVPLAVRTSDFHRAEAQFKLGRARFPAWIAGRQLDGALSDLRELRHGLV